MAVKVIIPCRFSFLRCWEPISINGSEPKYSVSAIIPKSDKATIEKIKDAIERVKKDNASVWGGKVPANLKTPLRDGDIDKPDDPVYKNSYFFNANSKLKPQVVDRMVQPILDQNEVYSGCYGNISVSFYAYAVNGNKGIAAGLGNIQKIRDGEALGSVTTAEEDFDKFEYEDENFDQYPYEEDFVKNDFWE